MEKVKRPKIEDYLDFNNYDEADVLDARGRLIDDMEKYSDCIEGKLKATAKICDIQEQQIEELKEKNEKLYELLKLHEVKQALKK